MDGQDPQRSAGNPFAPPARSSSRTPPADERAQAILSLPPEWETFHRRAAQAAERVVLTEPRKTETSS